MTGLTPLVIGIAGAGALFAVYAVTSLIERAKLAAMDPPPRPHPEPPVPEAALEDAGGRGT